MEQSQFQNLMATAQLAYNHQLPEETTKIYWQSLKDSHFDDAMRRLEQHIKTEKFFPRISDLRAPKRFQSGPRYLPPPTISRGRQLANRVMLSIVLGAGGVSDEKLTQLKAVKNAEAEDWDDDLGRHAEYRQKFCRRVEEQLRDQLCA